MTVLFTECGRVLLRTPGSLWRAVTADALRDGAVQPDMLDAGALCLHRSHSLDAAFFVQASSDQWLHINPDGFAVAGAQADAHRFMAIDAKWADSVLSLIRSQWLYYASEHSKPVHAYIHLLPSFQFELHGHSVPLSELLDAREQIDHPLRTEPLWRLKTSHGHLDVFRFHPLVYFTAFGKSFIFEQLAIALRTFERYSDYTGDFLLVSDRDPSAMKAMVPQALAHRVRFYTAQANKRPEYLTMRYRIFDMDVDRYTHLLYLDSDIVADGSIADGLRHMHLLKGIGLVDEHPGKNMQEAIEYADWFGGYLFERTGRSLSACQCLNSGAMFIPVNDDSRTAFSGIWALFHALYPDHAPTLDAFGDQPVTSFYLQTFSTYHVETLTRMVTLSRLENLNESHRQSGLMHFNLGVADQEKIRLMHFYLDLLDRKYPLDLLNLCESTQLQ